MQGQGTTNALIRNEVVCRGPGKFIDAAYHAIINSMDTIKDDILSLHKCLSGYSTYLDRQAKNKNASVAVMAAIHRAL
jgi:hypothetical protein